MPAGWGVAAGRFPAVPQHGVLWGNSVQLLRLARRWLKAAARRCEVIAPGEGITRGHFGSGTLARLIDKGMHFPARSLSRLARQLPIRCGQ
ncbi:hypothetical protein A9Q95_10620 [Rhodobacterales bacterium 59_46_T64]|nr:hypothetical protein A9Q95_10620 [Rhodobacterales bacterium 59_46_T64]